jgi:tRNA-uridine 2-sulfurtransferase
MTAKKARALVLFSGGLDSILVVRVLQEMGVNVRLIHFTSPFYSSEWARKSAKGLGKRLIEVPVGREYFRMVKHPDHGHGSGMNPCIDCKVYMLRRAERVRKELGMDFLATGEVVGERPMSQTKASLSAIEKSAGLAGRIVRPLSARILPGTEAEKNGLVKREMMYGISGRSRKPQIGLARSLGVRDYPAPAGGCLLTDPEYSRRLREQLEEEGSLSWETGELLKLGRHFRFNGIKIVVGRNREDNKSLEDVAGRMGLPVMEAVGVPGPVTVVVSKRPGKEVIGKAAGLTARYSDARKGPVEVEVRASGKKRAMKAGIPTESEVDGMRIHASGRG